MGWLDDYKSANPNFNFDYAQEYAKNGSYYDTNAGWNTYAKPTGFDEFNAAYQDWYKQQTAPQAAQPQSVAQPQMASTLGQLAAATGSQPQIAAQPGLDMSALSALTSFGGGQNNQNAFGPAFGGNYNKIGAGIGDLALLTR